MNNNLVILSWNIWFDDFDKYNRTISLVKNISIIKPDVICLQEVTMEVYEIIKTELNKETKYYYYPENLNKKYECVIISCHELKKPKTYNLESNMGRSLIKANILYNNESILISTCHYESEFTNNNYLKIKQFSTVKDILNKKRKKINTIIHCADTNISNDFDESMFFTSDEQNNWIDVWYLNESYIHKKYNNYTYDSYKNDYLTNNKKKYKSRLDRIIFTSSTMDSNYFKLYSGKINNLVEPSDHFAIITHFKSINKNINDIVNNNIDICI